jgi:K+-sensing histidine kinase KdpD
MSREEGGRWSLIAWDVAIALIAPACALLVAELIHSALGFTRLSLLFLAAVTVAASLRGSRVALAAALISVLCYKLFLDIRTVEETTPVEDLINLVIFLIVALVTGALAGKVHDQVSTSRRHAQRMELLFRASRDLAEEDDEKFWSTLVTTLEHVAGGTALALDPAGAIRGCTGALGPSISSAVEFARNAMESRGAAIARNGSWRARTLASEGTLAGVLVWETKEPDEETERVIDLLAELASAALARKKSRREQLRVRAAEEASKIRDALLSSISHDFRSPLAAIIGSSTSLLEYGDRFEDAVRRDLLVNIQHEGERLNEFVANLLDMSRLQSGVIQPFAETLNVRDVIQGAIKRLERHRGETLDLDFQGDCEVHADGLLLEQAIYNILDNAVKHGDRAASLSIACSARNATCEIIIADRGPGVAEEDLPHVFTPFHFAKKTRKTAGTGLGLSISRGFLEAMGGTVHARRRTDGQPGLEVVINIPSPC